MAFYNKKMAENKSLTKAWRAAHLGKCGGDEEISLPEICEEISRWMRRDRRPRSRLSLRSFSVLLCGATRLYNRQLSHLLKDTFKCSLFTSANPRPVLPAVKQRNLRSDTSTPTSGNQSESTEYIPDDTDSSCTDEDEQMSDESTVFTVTPNSNQHSANEQDKSNERRDQQIQTSPVPETPANIRGFDPNLPFGYIIVHDTYHSRIPSKIMFSSLSENVKFLPIRQTNEPNIIAD